MSQALVPAQDVVESLFREHDIIQSVLQLLETTTCSGRHSTPSLKMKCLS